MKIAVTAQEIRALLQLQEVDARAQELAPATYLSRREATLERVAKPLYERYQALIEAGRWPAIVAIDRGSCSGCHVRLPTMIEYQARSSSAVHTCPRCRRMVYTPEPPREDSSAAVPKKKAARRGTPASRERS